MSLPWTNARTAKRSDISASSCFKSSTFFRNSRYISDRYFCLFLFIISNINNDHLKIQNLVMQNFLEAVEAGYSKHKNPYHNLIHASDVLQTTYNIINSAGLMVCIRIFFFWSFDFYTRLYNLYFMVIPRIGYQVWKYSLHLSRLLYTIMSIPELQIIFICKLGKSQISFIKYVYVTLFSPDIWNNNYRIRSVW